MNEVMLKQSILKKNRDTINTTPNSVKSVRFNGVEFMVITDNDLDADDLDSDKSSLFDQHELYNEHYGRLKTNINEQTHSTLALNKKVNLFRLNQKKSAVFQENGQTQKTRLSNHTSTTTATATTKNLVFQSSAHTLNIRDPLSSSLQDLTAKSLQSSLRRSKWSQSFNRLLPTSSQRPPLPPPRSLALKQVRLISGSSSSSASSSIQGNHYQQNRITSANKSAKLNMAQSTPNLTLYTYLLQSNPKDPKQQLNSSLMRSQMKKLSSKTAFAYKPFVPKIQNLTPPATSNNFFSNSFKLSHSTSSLPNQSTLHQSKKLSNASGGGGGIIHVNTSNINFLTQNRLDNTTCMDIVGLKPDAKTLSINNTF